MDESDKMKRKISIKIKNMAKRIIYRLTMPPKAYAYWKKGKFLIKKKKENEALEIFLKGLVFHPNIPQLHAEVIEIAMKQEQWKLANQHWKAIFRIKNNKMKAIAFQRYAKALQSEEKFNEAETIILSGINRYPEHPKLFQKWAENLNKQKKWKKATTAWERYFKIEKEGKPPVDAYIHASLAYRKIKEYAKAEHIVVSGIKFYKKNKKLYNIYADIAIEMMEWRKSLTRLEMLEKLYNKNIPMNLYIKRSMIYQILGNTEEAEQLFDYILINFKKEIQSDKKGYRKIIFFDNGESRIEFYKKLQRTKTVVITFDSINMVWKNPPFGFKLLSRQNTDIIAVRKRRPNSHHQDLSYSDFQQAVTMLVKKYDRRIAYGFSLGGYASLYYGPSVDCTILSLAPRLSIHPKYGKPKEIPKFEFKHTLSLHKNPRIVPIVVYDPKEKLDNNFVENEVLKIFPNTNLVQLPYGGHGIAPHLLRMGVLKEFILTVINEDQVPKYDRTKKSKSNIYLRVLGQACLNRNKIKWAKDLVERSLDLLSTDKYAIKLKVKILKQMKKYDEAIEFTKSSIKLVPKIIDVRELLIDLYILRDDIESAKKELAIVLDIFGQSDKTDMWKQKLEGINNRREV